MWYDRLSCQQSLGSCQTQTVLLQYTSVPISSPFTYNFNITSRSMLYKSRNSSVFSVAFQPDSGSWSPLRGFLTFQSLPVTWCTNSSTFNNCTFFPHCIYVFCIYLRTNNDLWHVINWLVFITEMKWVYSAVRTGSLNKSVCTVRTGSLNKAVCAVRSGSLNKTVCAVRTGSFNKAVCASSLKG